MRRDRLGSEIKHTGLSYAQISKALGISKSMISHIVNCRHNPGWKLQQRLVKYFGITAEELLVENDKE